MDNKFEPKKVEEPLYKAWDSSGYFKPSGEGNPFCILIPPPNVTGTLHMGHAFNQTLMDTLIRFKRMDGENTLWQMGTDHAGIATQMLVERQLEQEGPNRNDLGRDEFISKVWEWKEKSGVPIILNTSFNVKGQPIVNSIEEAVNTFKKTNIDILFIGKFLIFKDD